VQACLDTTVILQKEYQALCISESVSFKVLSIH